MAVRSEGLRLIAVGWAGPALDPSTSRRAAAAALAGDFPSKLTTLPPARGRVDRQHCDQPLRDIVCSGVRQVQPGRRRDPAVSRRPIEIHEPCCRAGRRRGHRRRDLRAPAAHVWTPAQVQPDLADAFAAWRSELWLTATHHDHRYRSGQTWIRARGLNAQVCGGRGHDAGRANASPGCHWPS